jgi:hypothetical protein
MLIDRKEIEQHFVPYTKGKNEACVNVLKRVLLKNRLEK